MDSAFFLVVVEAKRNFFLIFFCFQNLDALYGPAAGKQFVLEDLSWAWHFCGICPNC